MKYQEIKIKNYKLVFATIETKYKEEKKILHMLTNSWTFWVELLFGVELQDYKVCATLPVTYIPIGTHWGQQVFHYQVWFLT